MGHATTPNLGMQDYFTTTLTLNVGASDTVINLANVPTATEGYLVIDPNNPATREIIYYTSKSSSTVTTPDATTNSGRGVGGTTVQVHSSGVLVEMREVAEYWQALQNGESMNQNSVTAPMLATDAITLGYAQITSNFTTTSTSQVQVTGLTTTVTIPSGGRKIKITVFSSSVTNGSNGLVLELWDGAVTSGTQIGQDNVIPATNIGAMFQSIVTPSAGSKTYNVSVAAVTSGTALVGAVSQAPAFILVEAI